MWEPQLSLLKQIQSNCGMWKLKTVECAETVREERNNEKESGGSTGSETWLKTLNVTILTFLVLDNGMVPKSINTATYRRTDPFHNANFLRSIAGTDKVAIFDNYDFTPVD